MANSAPCGSDLSTPTPSDLSAWQRVYPVIRLLAAMALLASGGASMYLAIIALKPIALEFSVSRASGSLPYTAHMVGFGLGGILMGWVSDRVGVALPALFGSAVLAAGLAMAAKATSINELWIVHGVVIALLGSASVFSPLVADISHWFTARRGMAVALVISGAYVAGAVWPPIAQFGFDTMGWRTTYLAFAWYSLIVMIPLSLVLLPRTPVSAETSSEDSQTMSQPLGMSPRRLQSLLCLAGVGCCAAMAVPQVHIVAHATDLGFEATDGARMLALMLGFGIISRLGSGWLSDRIGGLKTLLLGSIAQGVTIALFIPLESLTALYIASALFGLSQGGIVPSYAMVVRTFFPASDAGWRIGTALLFTMLGMALGAWVAGEIYDRTGAYTMAFVTALAFNAMNALIAIILVRRAAAAGANQ